MPSKYDTDHEITRILILRSRVDEGDVRPASKPSILNLWVKTPERYLTILLQESPKTTIRKHRCLFTL